MDRRHPSRSGPAAGKGDELGLLVGVIGNGDASAVLAAGAQHLVDRLHAHEEAVHLVGVEGLIEACGTSGTAWAVSVNRAATRRYRSEISLMAPYLCSWLPGGDDGQGENSSGQAVGQTVSVLLRPISFVDG